MAEKDIELMAREIAEGKVARVANKQLTNEELDEVVGGAYTQTIEQIECKLCGWISGFFVGNSLDDCQAAISAHTSERPGCPGVVKDWNIYTYDSRG